MKSLLALMSSAASVTDCEGCERTSDKITFCDNLLAYSTPVTVGSNCAVEVGTPATVAADGNLK